MGGKEFYIVDVFSDRRFAGNQLAVFTQGGSFTDAEMQQIAREINFSETTFIFPEASSGNLFRVRIFTPEEEVPFAGHPTLGTAYVIQKVFLQETVPEIRLALNVGEIPVTMEYDGETIVRMTMKQKPPVFGAQIDPGKLAAVLSLTTADVDERFPVQVVSTGLPFIIAPLKTMAAVQRARLHKDLYVELIQDLDAKAILFFAPETLMPENRLHVRVFTEYFGVPEDPATGSANGCLAGYLIRYGYFGQEALDISVEQGFEIGRDAILYLSGYQDAHEIHVYVGGQAAMFAKGELV
jgi:trans-2,3-dihydro-3-hydroxyanthranilate isomerase